MSAAGTGKLQFIEGNMNANMYCDITEAEHDPFPFRDWAAGQYSNMITTANTPPKLPLPC